MIRASECRIRATRITEVTEDAAAEAGRGAEDTADVEAAWEEKVIPNGRKCRNF